MQDLPVFNQLRVFITYCLLLLTFSLSAQQYNFKKYGLTEGLAQSQVYALCEDNKGYLWMGTRGGGLSRFDGVQFSQFTEEDGLNNNFIRALFKDSQGNIWIGTDQGLSIYDGKTFVSYTESDGLQNTVINDFCQDNTGVVWVATDRGIYQYRQGKFADSYLPRLKVTALYKNIDGNIWAGTQYGVYEINIKNATPDKHFIRKNGLLSEDIADITGDEHGNIWVASYGGGLNFYNGSKFKSFTTADGLPHRSVYTIYSAGSQKLWIGSSQGASILDYSEIENDVVAFRYYSETNGLSNNVVRSFVKDTSGDMWIGTSGGGVNRLDSERFIHLNAEKGKLGELVFAITEDEKGNVWLASDDGGISVFNGKTLERIAEKDGFTSGKVKCIFKDKKGGIWLGTTGNGAYYYNGRQFIHYTRANGLSSLFINTICEDRQGQIWFATAGGAVCYFNPQTHKFTRISSKLLGTDRINTVFTGSQNNILLGTLNKGLFKIPAFASGKEPEVLPVQQDKGKSPSNVRCIIEDHSGRILVGTAGNGIWIYNAQKGYTKVDLQGQPMSANIYFLHQDKKKQIWAGTDKGLYQLQINENNAVSKFRHFTRTSGFLGIEATHNAVYEDAKGNIWFGSISGVYKYNPEEDVSAVKPPQLHITGINLFFDQIQNTPYYNKQSASFVLPSQLDLPYDKNSLSFQFTGIYLKEPESVSYSWKMEGFDDGWSPVTSRREAIYSNLPPGSYTFLVKAKQAEGVWTQVPQSFSFTIKAPFWQQWWFRVSVVAVLLVMIWLFYYFRIKRLKRENEIEKQVLETEKKLVELEQKALHLQMNPHFLFNCLNSIKGLIAEEKPEQAKIYLNRFAKLMRSILDNSRDSFIALDSEIELLKNYVQLEKLSHGESFELEVNLNELPDSGGLQIPSMLIQPFVENAIIHGLALKKEKGLIIISFKKEEDLLRCTIEDNGIGRSAAAEIGKNTLSDHKSLAIVVIKERLKILTGREDAVSIEDMADAAGSATGTKVTLLLNYSEI